MKLIPDENTGRGNQRGMVPLRDVMNRLFNQSFLSPFGLMEQDPFFTSFFSESGGRQLPSADFSELDDRYRLEMDVPGFTEKDLDIELRDDTLILRGKQVVDNEEKNKTYFVRERRSTSWVRSFALPENAKLDQIECAVKEGKLTIDIPKNEPSKGKKLKINWK